MRSTRLVSAAATACEMLVERAIKNALKELATLEALREAALGGEVVVRVLEDLSDVFEGEPGSVVHVSLFGELPDADVAVGGVLAGGGGVQRQPLALMTRAKSATCSSCNLLR